MSSTKLQRLGETTFNKIDKIVSKEFIMCIACCNRVTNNNNNNNNIYTHNHNDDDDNNNKKFRIQNC